jgi:hypothetical protein
MLNFQTNPMLADAIPAMNQQDLQIHSTHDLSIFKTLNGNRDLNMSNVDRIAKSILDNGFLKVPIVVNENFEIIDGQHRVEAAKKVNSIIYYVKVKNYDLSTAILLNANASNWKTIDYVKSFCERGNSNYLKLMQLYESNKDFGLNTCAELTTDFIYRLVLNKDNSKSDVIKTGEFIYNDVNDAEYIFESMRKIHGNIPEAKSSLFCRTIKMCLKNPDFKLQDFVYKVNKHPHTYRKSNTISVIMANIEYIYNYDNKTKKRIYLSSK